MPPPISQTAMADMCARSRCRSAQAYSRRRRQAAVATAALYPTDKRASACWLTQLVTDRNAEALPNAPAHGDRRVQKAAGAPLRAQNY